MGNYENPDNSGFSRTLKSPIYVDKTKIIEDINKALGTDKAFICNSRPRRFGKSTTVNMLIAYYSKGCDSRSLFSQLDVSSSDSFEEHLNKHNVIKLDIKWCIGVANGPDNLITFITKNILDDLKEYYPFILTRDVKTVPEAMQTIYSATKDTFIVIIDEWDVLIRDESANERIVKEYIDFLRGLFKGLEYTSYIELAYLTGILPIKIEKTESALNNFEEYTMLNPGFMAPYIGFTEDEVEELFNEQVFL